MKLDAKLWAFSNLDWLYERFLPDSVYGKLEKDERRFFTNAQELAAQWNGVDSALNFLATYPDKEASVRDALSRLTLLPEDFSQNATSTDVFIIKKFLVNYARISNMVPKSIAAEFGIHFRSSELLDLLGRSDVQDSDETFYLTESFSTDLAEVRKEIRALDGIIRAIREKNFEAIRHGFGIDFQTRDFVVLSATKAQALPSELFSLEPFDSLHFVAKPVFSREYLEAVSARELLLSREKLCEEKVYRMLSASIETEFPLLRSYAASACALDIAMAKARLAREFSMVRPNLGGKAIPNIVEGRYLPLESRCAISNVRYWPLNLCVEKTTNVLFGSNMGGKTVVLRSVGFFQALAQMGFFVPCEKFESRVFAQISYVGLGQNSIEQEAHEGLSGFGAEVCEFSRVWEYASKPMLLLIDEFARTTNSIEAVALLGALLEAFSENSEVVSIVSTHFMDIDVSNFDCGFLRMKGLNHNALSRLFSTERELECEMWERVCRVNRYMQYEVVMERGILPTQDAITVAELLGLSPSVVKRAKRRLGERYGK